MILRCALLARIMKLPDTPVYTRLKDIVNAASRVNTCWTHHTITMFQLAISPLPPPTGQMTWHSMLPLATRNLRRLDEAFRRAEMNRNPNLLLYPKQGRTYNHQHTLYRLEMAFNKCKHFGSLRAGLPIFPRGLIECPACGEPNYSSGHILRSCRSTKQLLNTWLYRMSRPVIDRLMTLSETHFVQSLFDLDRFPSKGEKSATIFYVWDATITATRAAKCRANGNSAHLIIEQPA